MMRRERIVVGIVSGLSAVSFATSSALGAAAGTAWQPIGCVPADLAPEALYDIVQPVDALEATTPGWSVAAGGQHARASVQRDTTERHAGSASLRVDYAFVGKKDYEYIQLNGAAAFLQPGLGFGFWIKTDGVPFALRLRFIDAGGECHQVDLLASSQPGWQFVAGALDTHSTAWGGDGNRRKDYPCRLAGICIDRPRVGYVGEGCLWIDDVSVVKPASAAARRIETEVQGKRVGNIYAVGDSVALRARGDGDAVHWAVTDFFGRELERGEGSATSTEIRFTLRRPGWFSCRLELLADGQVVGKRVFPCAVLGSDTGAVRSDFFGVGAHYGQNAYPLETMDLMLSYGIDQFRDEVVWAGCETEKGRVTVPPFCAKYLQRARELTLRPLIIFDYSNRLYDDGGFPNSPEAIAAFSRYAVELVRQTRGTVSHFEVWNEWVGGCGMNGRPGQHDGAAYGRLLKSTYAAVKRAFPDVTVVGIGGEYGQHCAENILAAVRTAGPEAMDAWSIHPYRYPASPESSDLVGEVRRIASQVSAAGVIGNAWITEIGYPTHRTSGGVEERVQARYCVRTLALLNSMPEVGKVFWYDLKDDGLTREYNEHNFGLIRHQRYNCAPKPGIVAASVFVRMTGASEPKGLIRVGAAWVAAYRRADGADLLILWTEHGSCAVTVSGTVDGVLDMMGASVPLPVATAGENPVYLVGRELSVNAKP